MQRFAESIEDSVRGRDRKNEGVVTLRAPDGMAGFWIAPQLASFIDENPKIQLTLDCGGITAEMQVEPDLIVTAAEDDAQKGDVLIPFATLHYLFLAAPSYLERHGNPASIASAVSDHSALRHIGQVNQRESWGPRARAIEELVQANLLTNSSAVIVAATLGGAGICAAPSWLCHIYPSLQIVGPEVSIPIRLWLATRYHAVGSARVQRVALWLQALFDTKLNPWFRDEFIPPRRFAAELEAIDGRLAHAAEPQAHAPAPRRRRR